MTRRTRPRAKGKSVLARWRLHADECRPTAVEGYTRDKNDPETLRILNYCTSSRFMPIDGRISSRAGTSQPGCRPARDEPRHSALYEKTPDTTTTATLHVHCGEHQMNKVLTRSVSPPDHVQPSPTAPPAGDVARHPRSSIHFIRWCPHELDLVGAAMADPLQRRG